MIKKENTKETPKTGFGKFIQGIINFLGKIPSFFLEGGKGAHFDKEEIIEDSQRKLTDMQEKLETLKGSDLEKYRNKAAARLNTIKEVATKLNHTDLLKRVDDTESMLCFQYHSPS